jgi:hypothetical protein
MNLRLLPVVKCSAWLVLTTMLLSGCGRPFVVPKRSAMWTQGRTVDAGFACEFSVDTTLLPSFNPPSGFDFSVGVINWFIPGADPVPCWRRHEYRAIGLVRWDFRSVQALIDEGYRLDRAELVQRIRPITHAYGDYWEGDDLAVAHKAVESWSATNRVGDPSDPTMQVATINPVIIEVPFSPTPGSGPDIEETLDATDLVRQWLSGISPNHGLVYDSVTFGIGENRTRTVETAVDVDLLLYFIDP